MSQVAVAEKMTQDVAPRNQGEAMVSMLERVLMDPSVPVERLERLLELQDKERARQAKVVWAERMSEAQADMRAVLKDQNNTQTKSRYASYAALDEKVRPIYTKHGFSVTFNTEPCEVIDTIMVVAFVENAGFERRYEVPMPCDGKGAKGGDVMTKTHAVKSAVTYGKATLLPMIFNIAVTDKADDDGNGASAGPARITEEQVMDMRDLLDSTGADVPKFLEAARVERLEDIPAARFKPLCDAIKRMADRRSNEKAAS